MLKPLSITLNFKLLSLTLGNYSAPSPPPLILYPPSLSAEDFVIHFEKEIDDIRASFSQPIESTSPTHTELPYALTSFSPLSPDGILQLVREVWPPDNLPTRPLPLHPSPDHLWRPAPIPHFPHQLILVH